MTFDLKIVPGVKSQKKFPVGQLAKIARQMVELAST